MKDKIAEILRDNITYSPQVDVVVIHGAIEKIVQLIKGEVDYWKSRCEAAESVIECYSMPHAEMQKKKQFPGPVHTKWQLIKSKQYNP